jgi:hypothetical protein
MKCPRAIESKEMINDEKLNQNRVKVASPLYFFGAPCGFSDKSDKTQDSDTGISDERPLIIST